MRLFKIIVTLNILFNHCSPQHHEESIWRLDSHWHTTKWRRGPRAQEDRIIKMELFLAPPQASVEAAQDVLQAISDPLSARFGQYLSADQVSSFFAPSKYQLHETVQWLNASGIDHSRLRVSSDGGHITFNISVNRAEQLLGAEYFDFIHGDSVQLACETIRLHPDISRHIEVILPGVELGGPPRVASESRIGEGSALITRRARDGVDCFKYMTPDCYRSLYNIPALDTDSTSHPNNSIGMFQTAWVTWLAKDLDAFFTRYQPELAGHRPRILPINGGYLQEDIQILPFNLESNLDHEYSMSLAYPTPVTNVQVGDEFIGGNLNTMLAAFDKHYCESAIDANYDPIYPANSSDCGNREPPLVISISYVWDEASFSANYLRRQCLEYLKLGLRGVSVIASSGDRGAGSHGSGCIDPDSGAVFPNVTHDFFSPGFPASCPWVTTVGGTQLSPTNTSWTDGAMFPPETAWSDARLGSSSGGGFSRVFQSPFYQRKAVKDYLDAEGLRGHLKNLSTAGYFNQHGRGFPDVSAVAHNVIAATNDKFYLIAGTSASAPVFASMIARINDARLKAGKSPVGFLNPVLYGPGRTAFRDVGTGWNGGCGIEHAFKASSGWDAVTGLGSPDFERLLRTYLELP